MLWMTYKGPKAEGRWMGYLLMGFVSQNKGQYDGQHSPWYGLLVLSDGWFWGGGLTSHQPLFGADIAAIVHLGM